MHEPDTDWKRYRDLVGQDYGTYVKIARRAQAEEMRRLAPLVLAHFAEWLARLRPAPAAHPSSHPSCSGAPLTAIR